MILYYRRLNLFLRSCIAGDQIVLVILYAKMKSFSEIIYLQEIRPISAVCITGTNIIFPVVSKRTTQGSVLIIL